MLDAVESASSLPRLPSPKCREQSPAFFCVRMNAVVCVPARTSLTLSSPFPQKTLRFSQKTAHTWHVDVCLFVCLFKKFIPWQNAGTPAFPLPSGSELELKAGCTCFAPLPGRGAWVRGEEGGSVPPNPERAARPPPHPAASATHPTAEPQKPVSVGAGLPLAKKCPLHFNFPGRFCRSHGSPGPPRLSGAAFQSLFLPPPLPAA